MAEKPLILIADDDEALQKAVAKSISAAGYEPVATLSGSNVVAEAIELQPVLIVLDIVFPDGDGRDVLSKLNANAATAAIPVLVWSGSEPESARRVALDLGAEDFHEKVSAQTLMPKIARVLLRVKEERGGN